MATQVSPSPKGCVLPGIANFTAPSTVHADGDLQLTYDGKAPRDDNDPASINPKISGYLGMCPTAKTWRSCVDLATTENPPDWAKKSSGQGFENGWSCDGLVSNLEILYQIAPKFQCCRFTIRILEADNQAGKQRHRGYENTWV